MNSKIISLFGHQKLLKNITFKNEKLTKEIFLDKTLKNISFEKIDFNDIAFKNCHFEGCYFEESNLDKVYFEDSSTKDCHFRECSGNNINFLNSQLWDTTLFQCSVKLLKFHKSKINKTLSFDNNFDELEVAECKSVKSHFENNEIKLLILKKSKFEYCTFKLNQFDDSQFNYCINIYSIWRSNQLKSLNLDNSLWTKSKWLNNKGLTDYQLTLIKDTGAITKTLFQRAIRSPIAILSILTFFSILAYFIYSVTTNPQFEFLKYHLQEFSSYDIHRSNQLDFRISKSLLLKRQDFKPLINEIIRAKKSNNYKNFVATFKKALNHISYKKEDQKFLYWLVYEAFVFSETEKQWEEFLLLIQNKTPREHINQLNHYLLTLCSKKLYTKSSKELLYQYLINFKNNPEELNSLLTDLNKIQNYQFKRDIAPMLKSWLRRKINRYPQNKNEYIKMHEIVSIWSANLDALKIIKLKQ